MMATTARDASPVSPRKHHALSVNTVRPARALLADWTLSRFLATRPPSHVCTVAAEMTVGAALAAMNRHSILSAPVVDVNADVVGIMSVHDVLSAFLAGVYPGLLRGSARDAASSLADELAAAGAEFCERQVRALGFGGDGKLLYKARTTATLYELVSQGFLGGALAGARPHHRVAVWDLDGADAHGDNAMRVTAVVSQSDIVRCVRAAVCLLCCAHSRAFRSFLHRHASSDLGDLPGMSVEALGLDRKPVVTLPASTTALHAFAAMATAGVSAAGITASSAEGAPLVANLSTSDLRGLTPAGWGMLALPIAEFLLQKNGEAATATELREAGGVLVGRVSESGDQAAQQESTISAMVPLHTVHPSTTFGVLLAKFAALGVHHLWVLDDNHRPLGVITPTDVLRAAYSAQR